MAMKNIVRRFGTRRNTLRCVFSSVCVSLLVITAGAPCRALRLNWQTLGFHASHSPGHRQSCNFVLFSFLFQKLGRFYFQAFICAHEKLKGTIGVQSGCLYCTLHSAFLWVSWRPCCIGTQVYHVGIDHFSYQPLCFF